MIFSSGKKGILQVEMDASPCDNGYKTTHQAVHRLFQTMRDGLGLQDRVELISYDPAIPGHLTVSLRLRDQVGYEVSGEGETFSGLTEVARTIALSKAVLNYFQLIVQGECVTFIFDDAPDEPQWGPQKRPVQMPTAVAAAGAPAKTEIPETFDDLDIPAIPDISDIPVAPVAQEHPQPQPQPQPQPARPAPVKGREIFVSPHEGAPKMRIVVPATPEAAGEFVLLRGLFCGTSIKDVVAKARRGDGRAQVWLRSYLNEEKKGDELFSVTRDAIDLFMGDRKEAWLNAV